MADKKKLMTSLFGSKAPMKDDETDADESDEDASGSTDAAQAILDAISASNADDLTDALKLFINSID